jgi:hypothetical protein
MAAVGLEMQLLWCLCWYTMWGGGRGGYRYSPSQRENNSRPVQEDFPPPGGRSGQKTSLDYLANCKVQRQGGE